MLKLRNLAQDYEVSQKELGEIMGLPQSQVSNMMQGYRKIKNEHINALIAHFGKEVIDAYTVSDTPRQIPAQVTEAEVTFYEPKVVEEIKEDILEAEAIPYVTKDQVQARNVNIRKLIKDDPDTLHRRTLSDLFGEVDYIQRVITAEMDPLFHSGDFLFIRFLPDDAKLVSGAIYIMDTRTYGTMVRQVYVDGETYLLKALNPEYEELRVQRKDIYSVGLVVNMVRSDFNVPPASADLNAIIEQKNMQINELIAELRKANERMDAERARQDKLIERLLER
jgi:SOS-response transcriptional repressor LexA